MFFFLDNAFVYSYLKGQLIIYLLKKKKSFHRFDRQVPLYVYVFVFFFFFLLLRINWSKKSKVPGDAIIKRFFFYRFCRYICFLSSGQKKLKVEMLLLKLKNEFNVKIMPITTTDLLMQSNPFIRTSITNWRHEHNIRLQGLNFHFLSTL